MKLLQAAIGSGMYMLAIIAIIFLIGTPILTIIISTWLSYRDEKEQAKDSGLEPDPNGNMPPVKRNHYFAGCAISIVIIIIVIFFAILILDRMFPSIG